MSPKLKAALDYGPLIVFLAVFLLYRDQDVVLWGQTYPGLILATLVFVPLTVLANAVLWKKTGELSVMQLVTLVVVVVFGGLTIWLNDPRFIKMKPTLIYLTFAALLALGAMLGRNWLGRALGETMAVTMVLSGGVFAWSLVQSGKNQTIPSEIALNFPEAFGMRLHELIAAGLMLFVITLAVNMIARAIVNKHKEFSGAN